MELTGSRHIAADRATVWAALNDPEVLKASIPGCQEMTGSPEEGFEAVVKQKVGPVSATFRGAVQLSNVVPGESYTITGEGKGGAAGFAKGGADVRLADADGGTLLTYDVKANVGGKLAQLGSRIIDGFAKKMADQFFDAFRSAVEGPGAGSGTAGNGPAGSPPPPRAATASAPLAPVSPEPAAPANPVPLAAGTMDPVTAPAPHAAARPAAPTPGLVARLRAWLAGLFRR